MTPKNFLAAAFLLAVIPGNVLGYIHRMYSLQEVLNESTNVLVGKVKSVDPQRKIAVAEIERALKGGLDFREIQMNIGLAAPDQANYLLSLLKPGDPYIIFYQHQGWRLASCAHSGDTWFQLYADGDWNRIWWRMSHLEIYMNRTFNKSTEELIRVTEGVLAGKIRPPPPDPTVPRLDIRRRPPRRPSGSPAQTEILLAKNSTWKYFKGIREASADQPNHSAWRGAGFNDSSWRSGAAPFGYGDPPFGTWLNDMEKTSIRRGYSTIYLRRTFQIKESAQISRLEFDIDYDDGFIIWINEKEVASTNRPLGRISYDSLSSGQHESGVFEPFFIKDPQTYLVQGTNLIAIQVFNCSLISSDLKMDLEMKAVLVGEEKGLAGFRLHSKFNCLGGQVSGISWADVNGDERLDLYSSRSGTNLLLLNEGGSFADWTGRLGVTASSRSASWADYNLDDHPDLLTDNFRLLTNLGLRFQEDTALLVARKPPGARAPAGWLDYNGDGFPDILVASQEGLRLFANTGKGPQWFQEVSFRAGLGKGIGRGIPLSLTTADFDGDGYTDFFYHLGRGILFHNQGDGTFRINPNTGIELPAANYPGGSSFGDFDNDGDLDLFLSSPGKARLYRNQNDGTFQDVTEGSGDLAKVTDPSFAGAWGDVDGDGFLDLFVCHTKEKSRLYLGNGEGSFQDATGKIRLPLLSPAFAASFADVDEDGDLDLAMNLENGVQIFINDLPCPKNRGWLRVVVQAKKGLVGTVVRILDSMGKLLGMRELGGTENSGGQACPIAHFGLPLGTCRISAILSDGRVAQKKVVILPDGVEMYLLEENFQ